MRQLFLLYLQWSDQNVKATLGSISNISDANLLKRYINEFCTENQIHYQVDHFESGDAFLKNYTKIWNLVFVTNMAQYAIRGYEVDAYDFVVKPVQLIIISQIYLKQITDCVMACTTEDINRELLARNDIQLSYGLIKGLSDEITGTVSGQDAMRQATKNVLYMIVNSDAPTLYKAHLFLLDKIWIAIDVIFGALFICYYYRRHLKMKRWKEFKKSNYAEVKKTE